jgi:excinuclease ABC subunit C
VDTKPADIPTAPGVYRFRDGTGKVIYVGKAKNLRNRLSSYFASGLIARTAKMVATAQSVDWVIVGSETEALQLEYSWIKEFDPQFNIRYRDDKSYPYLAVSVADEFPRVFVYRGDKRKGIRYFGPYVQAWAVRDTLDHLLRVFPMRSCTTGAFRAAKASGRPCLLADINRCNAPCVGRVDEAAHRSIVNELMGFLSGAHHGPLRDIKLRMQEAAAAQDYEKAAVLRDDLNALSHVVERSSVTLPDDTSADFVAIASDELQSAVQVFMVRGGRVIGQRFFVMENAVESTPSSLLTDALMHVYVDASSDLVPREILVSQLPDDAPVLERLLSEIRSTKIEIRVPQRGDKRTLLETVGENAKSSLGAHSAKRSVDLNARSRALQEIQEALGLPEAPLRIECIDVSHIQGTQVVASLVVFEDGLPRKSDYRRYLIQDPRDDTASIAQVVTRRFRNDSDVQTRAYRPSLLVIDGGAPQISAAFSALTDLGITDLPVVGLAKRMEEIWLPNEEFPVILPRTSEGLFLLQRLRDEAHRFAITLHRNRRSKSMIESALDEIPGVGPARKKLLMKHFGSFKKLREASQAQLAAIEGIGPVQAQTIYEALQIRESNPAINMTTGEIIES